MAKTDFKHTVDILIVKKPGQVKIRTNDTVNMQENCIGSNTCGFLNSCIDNSAFYLMNSEKINTINIDTCS